jgi:hypothetical protein
MQTRSRLQKQLGSQLNHRIIPDRVRQQQQQQAPVTHRNELIVISDDEDDDCVVIVRPAPVKYDEFSETEIEDNDESTIDEAACRVCYSRYASATVQPCGCTALCRACAQKFLARWEAPFRCPRCFKEAQEMLALSVQEKDVLFNNITASPAEK